ncbi:hypothetical protein [Yoonia sp.]|uniref:hypothetical protein n=1 Tax=Yoonia sp. TaxID=2212373 RepID=UPI0039187669
MRGFFDFCLDHAGKLFFEKGHIIGAIHLKIGLLTDPKDTMRALAEIEQIAMDIAHRFAAQLLIQNDFCKHVSPVVLKHRSALAVRMPSSTMLLELKARRGWSTAFANTAFIKDRHSRVQ